MKLLDEDRSNRSDEEKIVQEKLDRGCRIIETLETDFENVKSNIRSLEKQLRWLLHDCLSVTFRTAIVCSFQENERVLLRNILQDNLYELVNRDEDPGAAAAAEDDPDDEAFKREIKAEAGQRDSLDLVLDNVDLNKWKSLGLSPQKSCYENVLALQVQLPDILEVRQPVCENLQAGLAPFRPYNPI